MHDTPSAPDPLGNIRSALASAFPGLPEVTVGVVDGLPDMSHQALKTASIEVLETMIPPDSASADAHGTGICSIIFGQGDQVRGIAPACSGLVLPIFFGNRSENRVRPASQLDLARAITFALERGVSIINISAGQKTFTPEAETHLEQALQRCAESRVLVVAAAGNDSCACIHLPAAVEYVIAVGASDAGGNPIEVSNWGALYRRNGLLAPGENLSVAVPGGGTVAASGTSYATAVVSGVAAPLLSVARREGYGIDAADIRKIIIDSATPCEFEGEGACDRYLSGGLDGAAALAMLHRFGTAPRISSGMRAAGSGVVGDKIVDRSQDVALARGSFAMLNSSSEISDAVTVQELGVSPSACSCQTKVDDENETSTTVAFHAGF